MKTRYYKVLRDLTTDYAKNLMLVAAIAIGVFGVGSILGSYSVLKREMADNYLGTEPASATIELEDSISMDLLAQVRKLPGIEVVERHATVVARMQVGDKWHPLLLFVIDDFAAKRLNQVTRISGAASPLPGEMLVERTAYVVMEASEGDELTIMLPHGTPKRVKLTGTVHDAGLAPAWQEQGGYGYITLTTLRWLGETKGFDQLRILVDDNKYSRDHITAAAASLADWLTGNGYEIHEIQVPPPGKHPHQGQMTAVMSIFTVFSFLILILGSILVSTSMATLMVKQVRQIGIMKTIGANSFQIGRLYLLMMLIICAIALLVSVPLSQLAARGFYQQIAVLLNLEIRNGTIPQWVSLLQVASGTLVPLVAAAFPVVRGSRVSVRKALDNYGVSGRISTTRVWLPKLSQSPLFSETFLLSLRNVGRHRTRLVMTLALLGAGGAMFMTALNVSEAWNENLSRIYTQRLYDLEIKLAHPVSADTIVSDLKTVAGVSIAEGWESHTTSFIKENDYEVTYTYPDKGHGSFTLQALPLPTRLLNPTVTEGRWLTASSKNEVVLNQLARGIAPNVKLGDHVTLSVGGQPVEWEVVGFTEDVGTPATAYVSINALAAIRGNSGKVNTLRIAYEDRSSENAMEKNVEVEKLLTEKRIPVTGTVPVWLLHNAIAGHMKVLINSLLAMAVLMGVVGMLGLMSTMSMNIMERTREIGVMRAIGATPRKIKNLVMWEGIVIGMLSILIAFGLSLVLSSYLGRFIGNMAFRTPLSLTLSVLAVAIWVLIIVAGSYAATVLPARRANGITTREALAYE